jgi:hypothetical protein
MLSDAEILLDVFANGGVPMSKEVASGILEMRFTEKQRARMVALSERSSAGKLSPTEREMESYAQAGTFLSILHSRARQVLRGSGDSSK